MNTYSDENPPKFGTAKKIYDVFKENGWKVVDLHYNPNCWGHTQVENWGTWACNILGTPLEWGWDGKHRSEYLCGAKESFVYLQQPCPPYTAWKIGTIVPQKEKPPKKYIWEK